MSATTIKNNKRTFVAGEAIDAYLVVVLGSSESVTKAGGASASESVVGLTTSSVANADSTGISLIKGGATAFATASKAIDAGEAVYTAASGKITDDSSTGTLVGLALEGASADGDVIEIAF